MTVDSRKKIFLAIVEQLNRMVNDALAASATRQALETMGFDVRPTTPSGYAAKIENDSCKWQEMATGAKILLQ